MEVVITPACIDAYIPDVEKLGAVAGLNGAVHKVNRRAAIFLIVAHRREMENPVFRELPEGLDESLLNRVELVGLRRQVSKGNLIRQPIILKISRFEDGCGRIGVVFEQFCRTVSVVGKIEATI